MILLARVVVVAFFVKKKGGWGLKRNAPPSLRVPLSFGFRVS